MGEKYYIRRSTLAKFNLATPTKTDQRLTVGPELKTQFDIELKNISPSCSSCHQSLYNPDQNLCSCSNNSNGDQEFLETFQKLDRAERALKEYKSFRDERNGFGAGCSVIGATNFTLANFLACGVVATGLLLVLPALLVAGVVYYRGRCEENEMLRDTEAELNKRKADLICKYIEYTELRVNNPAPRIAPPTPISPKVMVVQTVNENNEHKDEILESKDIKPYKEKRSVLFNSASHFIFPFFATAAATSALLKFVAIAGLIAVGGPATWIITAVCAVGAGLYFRHKRKQNLTAKIELETSMSALAEEESRLDTSIAQMTRPNSFNFLAKRQARCSAMDTTSVTQVNPVQSARLVNAVA